MLQIIFISIASLLATIGLVFAICKNISLARTLFLLAVGFFLAYTIVLMTTINYSFVSLVEIAYIILMVFAIVIFIYLLITFIRKRN